MPPANPIKRLVEIFHEYPRPFWTVVIVNFIDRLGGSILFPFFALYVTKRFAVSMTQVGVLFAVWAGAGFIGSFLGGALTDRLGRRGMIIFSLVATSAAALGLGLVGTYPLFFAMGFVAGIFTDIGSPAYNAIVADLLPEEKRAQGYGIVRVGFNLAVVFGPVIGGFLATRSYLALFVTDAVISLVSAAIVFLAIRETKPEVQPGQAEESTGDSFKGYLRVFRDGPFVAFALVSFLAWLAYMNMNTTLGVYLRNAHGIPESGYGWILSLNALMVVLMQLPITRRMEKRPPMLLMAVGALLLGAGFAMYGLVSAFVLLLTAMAVITLGEMIMVPISTALVASFAPEAMRGRYSFVYGLSWGLSYAAGPYLAGLIMDGPQPSWLWYGCGILGLLSAIGFLVLNRRSLQRARTGEEGTA